MLNIETASIEDLKANFYTIMAEIVIPDMDQPQTEDEEETEEEAV